MVEKAKQWLSTRQLGLFIAIAILLSGVAVGISMWLYASTGAIKLDLSRPGYEEIRKEVNNTGNKTDTYPSTGEMNNKSAEDFRNRYNDLRKGLDSMSKYDESALDDENLGLSQSTTEEFTP